MKLEVWHYFDVPKNVFDELLESDSKGSFMRNQIIGEYDEIRVNKKQKR